MNNKLLSLLGLARRSRRLAAGYDAAVESVRKGESKLLLVANGAAARTERNLRREAECHGVEVLALRETMDDVGTAIGAARTGIVSVLDAGFAGKIRQIAAEATGRESQNGED